MNRGLFPLKGTLPCLHRHLPIVQPDVLGPVGTQRLGLPYQREAGLVPEVPLTADGLGVVDRGGEDAHGGELSRQLDDVSHDLLSLVAGQLAPG